MPQLWVRLMQHHLEHVDLSSHPLQVWQLHAEGHALLKIASAGTSESPLQRQEGENHSLPS